jgi:uncharacterized hydantoinase/oxoprolinase family protein
MALRDLAKNCVDSYGLLHMAYIRALRLYIKETLTETLLKELDEVSDNNQLRAIWEAGVPKQLQEAFLKRMR